MAAYRGLGDQANHIWFDSRIVLGVAKALDGSGVTNASVIQIQTCVIWPHLADEQISARLSFAALLMPHASAKATKSLMAFSNYALRDCM